MDVWGNTDYPTINNDVLKLAENVISLVISVVIQISSNERGQRSFVTSLFQC